MGEVCPGSQPTTLMAQNGGWVSVVSTCRVGEKVSDPPRSRTSIAGSPLPAGVVDAPAGDDVLAVDDRVVLQDLDPVLHVRREEDAAAGPDDVRLVADEVPDLPAERDLDLLVGMRVALRLGPGGIEHERDLEPVPRRRGVVWGWRGVSSPRSRGEGPRPRGGGGGLPPAGPPGGTPFGWVPPGTKTGGAPSGGTTPPPRGPPPPPAPAPQSCPRP